MKIIPNLLNLSVADLLTKLCNTYKCTFISETDFFNHIRINTNGFQKDRLDILFNDLFNFISVNESDHLISDGVNPFYLDDLLYNGFEDIDVKSLYDLVILYYLDVDHYKYDGEGYLMIDINKYDLLFQYSKVLEKEYIKLYGKQELSEQLKLVTKKEDLTFVKLFKKEYQKDEIQSKFISWLIRERYLNHSNEIICDYTNFARLYYFLRENGIVNPNIINANAMRTYFGKFEVEVVDSVDRDIETPQVTGRTLRGESVKTTEMLDMNDKEKNTLLSIFKPN